MHICKSIVFESLSVRICSDTTRVLYSCTGAPTNVMAAFFRQEIVDVGPVSIVGNVKSANSRRHVKKDAQAQSHSLFIVHEIYSIFLRAMKLDAILCK